MLGTGFRGSAINHHLNSGNNHNLSSDCSQGTNSTQATSGSTQVLNRGDSIRVAEQPGQPSLG